MISMNIAVEDLLQDISSQNDDPQQQDTSPAILVSEFPPPPYYYTLCSSSSLIPPGIPTQALHQVAKHIRIKLDEEKKHTDKHCSSTPNVTSNIVSHIGHDEWIDINTLPAVFGEIVEDPLLMHVENYCDDPQKIQQDIFTLRSQVLRGFIQLLQHLVNDPLAHSKCLEEISQNILNMLLETNKFREHQGRELFIGVLEAQLSAKIQAIKELRDNIEQGRNMLEEMSTLL